MENMRVYRRCLMGIECKEGRQLTIPVSIDPDEGETKCDWCEETTEEGGFDELYELI